MIDKYDELRDQLRKRVEGKQIRIETCMEIQLKVLILFEENNLSPAEVALILDLLKEIALMEKIVNMFNLKPREKE